jgi:hypothetical protein
MGARMDRCRINLDADAGMRTLLTCIMLENESQNLLEVCSARRTDFQPRAE